MSKFETVLLDILKVALAGGEILGPVFVHSAQGIAILNASEELVSAVPTLITPAPAAAPASNINS